MIALDNCIVFGGGGFIGSHLVDALLEKGHRVRCFNRSPISSSHYSHINNSNFELFVGDICNDFDVANALKGCTICFHLISTTLPSTSNENPVYDIESNLLPTIKLLNHASKVGIKKIIFVSSGGTIYGNPIEIPITENHPTNPICSYGIHKLAVEKYLALYKHLYGLNYAVLRVANPFGERQNIKGSQGAIAVFITKIMKKEPIEIWGDGSTVRDYIYVADVVSALVLTMKSKNQEIIVNIGSGNGRSINEVLNIIEMATDTKAIRQYRPKRKFDVPINVLSINHAKNILGWSPQISFEKGVERFEKWLSEVPELIA